MKKYQITLSALFLAGAIIFSSCSKDDEMTPDPTPAGPGTIAQIATDNGNFTILLDALTRTDLDAVMADENQSLTVFAPTDEAFVDLLGELGLDDLDAVENALGTEGLKNVLLYHVLGAEVTSDMVTTGYVSTLGTNASADPLSIYANTSNGVMINDRATVTTADVMASNGVIHIIDQVILPLTIYELLSMNEDYATLTAALGIADGGLDALLNGPSNGPFTLLAPNEAAFADLLAELEIADVTSLVAALGTDGLSSVLTYHVVAGNINSDELPTGPVATVNGDDISISIANVVTLTDTQDRTSQVTSIDIQGTNGVVHGINTVVLPNL
jgi:transforming growth factor-beta-induced protein